MNSAKSPKSLKRVVKQRSEGRKKVAKDPNAPKKAMTAFMLFSADKRKDLKSTDPNMKITEMAKQCGRLWREISGVEKEKYMKQSEEAKKKYSEALQAYNNGK